MNRDLSLSTRDYFSGAYLRLHTYSLHAIKQLEITRVSGTYTHSVQLHVHNSFCSCFFVPTTLTHPISSTHPAVLIPAPPPKENAWGKPLVKAPTPEKALPSPVKSTFPSTPTHASCPGPVKSEKVQSEGLLYPFITSIPTF